MSTDTPADATRRLDVRTIDGEPFSDIMSALSGLDDDETLLLVNSFEPKPLYVVLKNKGFDYESNQIGPEEWHVRITRT
ncbi:MULTISPECIES: DUF2249 domain-containing protein [Haloprofundus]|uniref:DUF2249 domain-containing protein n=1 Tax=Haloprofundus TaxID=1911573 RepID=UPI000E4305B8|nr:MULTISPECIES: DUF2249 domain-containing protein [Haloprofundus]